MVKLSDENKIEFYRFLSGDITVSDLEKFIYRQSDLEQQLGKDTYLELISYEFKDKYVNETLPDFIKTKIIEEGQFEAWKLINVLQAFLTDPKNLHIYLDKLYHLYCGVYNDSEKRRYQFRFLANLGLNYLYWVDKSYLIANYGDKWKQEYERRLNDFDFYHE